MSDTSSILSLPYLLPSQAQKHVTHNEALRLLDILVQTVAQDRTRTEAPGGAEAGDSHIVAEAATGLWAGQDHALATFDGTTWRFLAPRPGWSAQVLAENRVVVFDGTGWSAQGSATSSGPLTELGIGTSPDSTNRLAVLAPATLLTHDGAGHQLKINKSADTDTASLLFQTSWSGRAEMGTAGNDNFTVKVSADGSSWFSGFEIDAATGQTNFPNGAQISGDLTGTAVQQSADDATPGRLMRADFGYGPATVLGTVSQTGGQPTGAVIERGSTVNGDYVRFADGTQICTHTLDLTYQNATKLTQSWTYPMEFDTAQGLFLTGMIDMSSFSQSVTGPDITQVLDVRFGTITRTSTLSQMLRISGALDFLAVDTCTCRLMAIGRWS